MGNVVVVGYSPVLASLLMVGRKQQMRLVSVADVRPIHGVIKHGRTLVLVETAPIVVVELKANAQTFAGIHAE